MQHNTNYKLQKEEGEARIVGGIITMLVRLCRSQVAYG